MLYSAFVFRKRGGKRSENLSSPSPVELASHLDQLTKAGGGDSLFYDAFSVTRLYSVDDRVASEEEWTRTNILAIRGFRTHGLRVQANNAYVSDQAATGTGVTKAESRFRNVIRFIIFYFRLWIVQRTISRMITHQCQQH
jgi:hypothetical protein